MHAPQHGHANAVAQADIPRETSEAKERPAATAELPVDAAAAALTCKSFRARGSTGESWSRVRAAWEHLLKPDQRQTATCAIKVSAATYSTRMKIRPIDAHADNERALLAPGAVAVTVLCTCTVRGAPPLSSPQREHPPNLRRTFSALTPLARARVAAVRPEKSILACSRGARQKRCRPSFALAASPSSPCSVQPHRTGRRSSASCSPLVVTSAQPST